nr:extracellular matrix/biofilm biosynthesis regulator RemA family protein [uncultured Bacillus sp.]
MYIYLGDETLVNTRDIIAILDKESTAFSTDMDNFHHHQPETSFHQKKDSVKSVIVTSERIYYSPLATGTLKKRTKIAAQEF